MTQEEKQIELLNRHYTNIEGYKTMRFTIPTTVCSLLIGIVAILVSNLDKIEFLNYKFWVSVILTLVSIFGIVALKLVRQQYDNLAKNIYHLYDKLNILGDDFYPRNNDHNTNPKQNAGEIFLLGYSSIVLIWFISIIITLFL